jgi:hypothetical protein
VIHVTLVAVVALVALGAQRNRNRVRWRATFTVGQISSCHLRDRDADRVPVGHCNHPRRKTNFVYDLKLITGLRSQVENILLSFFRKSCCLTCIPSRSEGRIAIVTKREAGCGGRSGSQRASRMPTNEIVADVKSCGPGAPTLALSLRVDPQATVAIKPGHRGDHV